MKPPTIALSLALVVATLVASPVSADEAEDALKKDLTAVIALQGLPCGEVTAVKVLAESDFAATCKDGNAYHVYLNTTGRVVVERQK